ncbi:MAG: hypothetical protein A2X94_04315 [Bdellovibrionales bacterium GWB1_55_8]|nr:MAG: hypothetical protein A2X94_04315 [Bdellovibrionales bacterium GWB1_55_8]
MYVQIANAALVEGDVTGSLENLMKAESEDPKYPETYHTRALAFIVRKEPNEALREARRAVQLNPDYPEGNNTLGKLLMDAGRYKEAETHLKRAGYNNLYRDSFKPLTSLGIIYYRKGEYKSAMSHLDRAINSAPQFACIAYYYRGHLQLRESRVREAVSDYDRATRSLCANFGDAHYALGIAYVQSRQYDLARKKFLEVQQRFPDTELSERAIGQLRYLP